jgi:anaerobic selenocysteine-containing dehydrogenase
MSDESRRNFLATSAKFVAGSAALACAGALASSQGQEHASAGDGMHVDAAVKNTCGTCQYWGGMRKLSKDKNSVSAQSMGWCNNPESMNYHKLTAADHVMKKPGMWKKWPVI